MNSLFILFFVLAGLNFVLLLFTVLTAGWYDIKTAKSERLARRKGSAYHPHVTVLVPAHNESGVIIRCLKSLAATRYPNFDVIVVNDGSKDDTSRLAQDFIKESGLNAQVVDLYPNRGKGGALNHIVQHYKLGTITMVLDADCTLAPESLARMVSHFADGRVMAASSNVRINSEWSLLAIFQQLEYIIGYYHKRHNAITNSEFIIGGQGATYWTDTIKIVGGFRNDMQTEDIDLSLRIALRGNTRNLLAYAPDSVVYTEAVPNIRSLFSQRYRWKFGAMQALWANHFRLIRSHRYSTKMLIWYRIPQAVFGELRLFFDLIIFIIFFVIAVATRSPAIFLGAWLSITLYTSLIVLSDEHTPAATRIKLILINPLLFPLHFGMTVLNVVAAFKMIYNWKELFGRRGTSGSWTPPDRIGREHLS